VLALLLTVGRGGAEELVWSAPLAVADVLAGDRLALADGRTVRLAGIRLPAAKPAVAAQARAQLTGLVADHAVRLGTTAAPIDRYGDLLAQVEREDGKWLQGALLEQGLAIVHTRPDESAQAKAMLTLERSARQQRLGLWADPVLWPRDAARLADATGSFQIVQGRVRRVARAGDYLYLDFGADWRSDFTVRVQVAEIDGFERAGLDVMGLAGRRIEVRGFVLEAGGPLIEVFDPEQIQILPDAAGGD
jgi:endonuclease YncB( thermonuclease family)